MKDYIKIENEVNYIKLKKAVEIIKSVGIVVFPTETVYGIGANALDENAIKRLYKVKQRPLAQPFSLLVSDLI